MQERVEGLHGNLGLLPFQSFPEVGGGTRRLCLASLGNTTMVADFWNVQLRQNPTDSAHGQ